MYGYAVQDFVLKNKKRRDHLIYEIRYFLLLFISKIILYKYGIESQRMISSVQHFCVQNPVPENI